MEGGSKWPFPTVLLTLVHVQLNAQLGHGAACLQTQGWAGEGTEPAVCQAENGSRVTPGVTVGSHGPIGDDGPGPVMAV